MKRILNSLRNATRGMRVSFSEKNMRIHAVATLIVILLGILFQISAGEWVIQTLCVAIVIAVELINTALERLCDHVNPHYHQAIKDIKDISAAAVLITAVLSALIALIIYVPKFLSI